jgi:hypothetical protein
MGTDTDMGLALNRRANVFNSLTIDPSKDVMGSISALFSVVCGKENNCMSGIAMFIVSTGRSLDSTAGRGVCHY